MPEHRSWPAIILGFFIAAIGLVLTGGGIWLATLGGSLYYGLAGIAMLFAGVMLMRSRMSGAYAYIAVVAVTLLWAFFDASSNLVWALVPRIVAPIILLIATFLVMPTLTRAASRWKLACVGIGVTVLATALLFTVLGTRDVSVAALPAPNAAGMMDPSGMAAGADWPSVDGSRVASQK